MTIYKSADNNCFTRFVSSIEDIDLPERFTFPFNYKPHKLCVLAANELQLYLLSQTSMDHDFGIDNTVDGSNIGKMFGVLVVRNDDNEIGYLSAFSGKVGGSNFHDKFVPPIVDMLHPQSFWRIGEAEVSAMNHRISAIEESTDYHQSKALFEEQLALADGELEKYRRNMKVAKNKRDALRLEASTSLAAPDFELLKESLKNESLKWQYDYKQLVKYWKEQLDVIEKNLLQFTSEIAQLKESRKVKSALLQQQLFDQYHFLNHDGITKSVCDIFAQTDKLVPPAGAGDCAAPKLLQYAFSNKLQPLAMAEFWWGQSLSSEIRQHKQFYPSCKSKCEPILGFMLHGIPMDINPVLVAANEELPEIIFDDDALGVLIKPAEYLSVPGTTIAPSVLTFLQQKYPLAKGPIIVHRLDMSTSGLMVFTKTMEAYHSLQQQFLNRTVKKRYVALLDGVVSTQEGIINLPLRPDYDNRPRQLVCYQYGKPATTQYKLLSCVNNQSRIQFEPITGRTHQLRMHAAHILGLNCSILGDDLYGKPANRLHLHAQFLQFTHPTTNEIISFISEPNF